MKPVSVPVIPDKEFRDRLKRAAAEAARLGLDILLVNSTEADFSNVRYFSEYWPLFEIAGVAITPSGKAALLIGPESENFARDRSKIDRIYKMIEYRESADPAYPGVAVANFKQVFSDLGVSNPKRIGIGGYLVTTAPVLDGLRQAFPKAKIERADVIMVKLRSIKSEAEIACLRKGIEITDKAMKAVYKKIKPGMTELQVVGIFQQVIYENGAEYEGLPGYVLSGPNSRHAISRPTHRVMRKGDLVQLNLSARVSGYSPSIGTPVCLGKMTKRMKEMVSFCLEAHQATIEWIKAGVIAADVAKKYHRMFIDRGYADNFLYGPCHGLGMIEVEPPWMEETSEYPLVENMTFQVDSFLFDKTFGLRWETGGRVTKTGYENFGKPFKGPIEIE